MKLPSLCYRKHVAYVSVGDDREAEDWRLDDEKIDSSPKTSQCCRQHAMSCTLKKDVLFQHMCCTSRLRAING